MLPKRTIIGDYRIEGVLGQGGMGVVYEAIQVSRRRNVALKVLAPHLSNDAECRERFRREGQAQGSVEHDHIVPVYAAGEVNGSVFISMRLIRGWNLKDLMVLEQPDARRTLHLLLPIAAALDAAHSAGLIHRDIKPQNVLVDADDHPYLADFGLTRVQAQAGLTKSGQFVGTFDYLSPEAVRGEPVSKQSDLYAFAAVLYECLTGVVPYPKDSEVALLHAHVYEPPPRVTEVRSHLPATLDAVIARGMAKAPEERYASACELMSDVARALSGETQLAATRPVARGRQSILRPRLIELAATVLVILSAAGFLIGRSTSNAEPAALASFASAGGLALSFPNDWQRSPESPRLPGLDFPEPIALSPSDRDARERLVAGRVTADGPALLPTSLLRQLRGEVPRRDTVRIGKLEAYRYRNLELIGSNSRPTLYAVPTSGGVATIACDSDGVHNRKAFLRECERIVTSLELTSGRPFAIGPDAPYAAAMASTIRALDTVRQVGRTRLSQARTRAGQARIASELADAYAVAARSAGRLSVSPAVRPAHAAIVAALNRAVSGYEGMASAARRGSHQGYESGRISVRAGETALQTGLERLEKAGYTIKDGR